MPEDASLVAAMVAHCCNVLGHEMSKLETRSGIVVGCGSGEEVVYMRRDLGTRNVVGLDLEPRFSPAVQAEGRLVIGDAQGLPFRSESFDFAAAFHSLEHVADVPAALNEICRVLRSGAWFYMGVPNRSRMVGYLGAPQVTAWEKLTWNLKDWKARLQGRFRNECGAHAGFSRRELIGLLQRHFTGVRLLTEEFIRFKYGSRLPGFLLDLLLAPRLLDYSAPAHYAICRKPG